MIIRRFKRHIASLRQQPEDIRWRAATRWTMASGGILALFWVSVLLPIQIRSSSGDDDSSTEAPTGVVQGVLDTSRAAAPQPTPVTQKYHGTRPTQREESDLTPYTLTTPTPSPTPSPTLETP